MNILLKWMRIQKITPLLLTLFSLILSIHKIHQVVTFTERIYCFDGQQNIIRNQTQEPSTNTWSRHECFRDYKWNICSHSIPSCLKLTEAFPAKCSAQIDDNKGKENSWIHISQSNDIWVNKGNVICYFFSLVSNCAELTFSGWYDRSVRRDTVQQVITSDITMQWIRWLGILRLLPTINASLGKKNTIIISSLPCLLVQVVQLNTTSETNR